MIISDILKLSSDVDNLNVISDYISKTISTTDYEAAVSTYLKIARANSLNDLVLKQGNLFLAKVENQEPSKYRELIYSHLINSAISLNKFKDAKRYIEDRKELLPIIYQHLSLLDELALLKASNEDVLEVLLKLKIETLPVDTHLSVLEQLLNYYLNNKDYEDALIILSELKEYSLKDEYDEIFIEINYNLAEYNFVVDAAKKLLALKSDSTLAAIYYIAALVKLNNLRLASTLEAMYEESIDNYLDDNLKNFAYNTIIDLYTKINNQLSINLYKSKLKKLSKPSKVKEIEVVEKIKEVIKVKEIKTQTLISSAKYLEHFDWTFNWLIKSHKIDLKLPFREYLRELFIILNEKVNFKEAILYVDNIYESNFFNYKKQRLYDKLVINEYIDNTVISNTIINEESIFSKTHSLLHKKDVLTQKNLDESIKYVYSYYISKGIVLVFYLEEELNDPSIYYELFKGFSYIIYTRIIDEQNIISLQSDARTLNSILNNKVIATRVMTKYRSNYNDVAIKLFNIDAKFHLELFLRRMDLVDAKEYEKHVDRLFNYPNEDVTFTFKFDDITVKEYMFAIKNKKEVTIYSYFIDVSSYINQEEKLLKKANRCLETNLLNKNALEDNIRNLLKDKTTFVLIELNEDLSSIYGNSSINKFFIEFANITSKHFKQYNVYRYDFNQLLVVFDFNDIRTVDKELSGYFHLINNLKSSVLKYERFNAKAGVLRYPVATAIKNFVRINKYLDISLQKAKLNNEIFYSHFIQDDYEIDVFEQEVIDYINTAIESRQLAIKFKQIIDITNNVVWNYESRIYLPNITIDEKYLYLIAKKRKKLVDLENHHIIVVANFLQLLNKETGHYIKITIPISKETFRDANFVSHLISTLKINKVSSEFIRILLNINDTNSKDSLKIDELLKLGISVDVSYIEPALKNEFNAVHLKFKNYNSKEKNYFKLVNELLANNLIALVIKDVPNKDAKDFVSSLGIKYVEGKLYQELEADEIISKVKDVLK